jgi:5-methylcytosine-specific restriction protein A
MGNPYISGTLVSVSDSLATLLGDPHDEVSTSPSVNVETGPTPGRCDRWSGVFTLQASAMPNLPRRPCTWSGCTALISGTSSRCERHRKIADRERGTAQERGYSSAWQKARKAWLAAHPLCACDDCDEGRKRTTLATVVDHRIPHKGDKALFWDSANWQSMAKACHDRKTAREDGGFGRAGGGQMSAGKKP